MASREDNPKQNKKKRGKKVRVDFRRNRTQPPREKDWTRRYRDKNLEDIDTVTRESIIPKGDISRKRTIIEDHEPAERDLRDGRVVTMRGLIVEVDDGDQIWPCTVRRILRTRLIEERHPVTTGDRVRFYPVTQEQGRESEGVIYSVHPRSSQLTRRYGDRVHVIAANVDQVLIVASAAEPALKPHLIDRYIVSAHAGGIDPLICINKVDLVDSEELYKVAGMYHKIGYRALLLSAQTREGLDALADELRDKETVVVGQSGVGKSSLLNALQPGLQLVTSEVSESTSKGRHTTTTAFLLRLDFGGYVVDTPGVRSYDMADVPKVEYEMYYVEFLDHIPKCKFPDCTHIHESDCAVKQAVESGKIDPRRYESYIRLFQED